MLEKEENKWSEIAAKIHHELSGGEEKDFNVGLSDDQFKKQYEETKQIYDILRENPIAANRSKSWEKVKRKVALSRVWTLKSLLRYAAIFIIALGIGYFLHSSKEQEIHYSEISVPYGQMSQLVLSDGTKVWLNSGTSLKYPDRFGAKQRSVYLDGEAFFEISGIPEKPFFVHLDDIQLKVVGTSFNVSAYKEDMNTSVALVEGEVVINNSSGEKIAQLLPQQTLSKKTGTTEFAIAENVDTRFYNSWKNGTIYFEDQTLEQITSKLERWYNVEIIFADPSVKNYKFTGTILKNKPVDQVMQVFELLLSVRFEQKIKANSKDQIIIYKSKK